MGHRGICEFHQLKVIFRSINRKLVHVRRGRQTFIKSCQNRIMNDTIIIIIFFISLFFTANFTGYSRLLGEETSRNHQAYKERPAPGYHNIIKNKGCEEVRLN